MALFFSLRMNRRSTLGLLLAGPLALRQAALAQESKPPLRAPDIYWEPSTDAQTLAMLRLAKVTRKDVVYDLGCGDGKVVITAAKVFGARGVGIDIDPVRIGESITNARKQGVANRVRFRNEDLFEADIREATVVTLFLYQWINLKLRPKLLKELKPGTRVVSNYHHMGGWKPEKEIEVDGNRIFLWTIPEEPPEFSDSAEQ
jgi:SAM-dependent methyltransferase